MSDSAGRMGRFAERYGIDRKRATIGAALLAGVLLISLFVMNQRIQERRASAAEAADSAAVPVPVVEPVEQTGERAAWTDPREARKLAGDTLPAVPEVDSVSGGEYVPLGRDVGPDGYGATSLGEAPSVDSAAAGAYGQAGPPSADARPLTPEEVRRALFQRAVAARQLRPRKPADADSAAGLPGGAGPGAPASSTELKPYGPEQMEEDRRAAEQAAQQIGERPQAAAATRTNSLATFASFRAARPCRAGERVLPPGMITVTLVSGVDSEHPGPVFARIGRDVYDASLRCVIIPAGALLVGRYADSLEIAGRRLAVIWEQVVLGDGRTWSLPAFPSADRQGAIGIPGEVDRRTRATFETAALLSAFGAALEYATPGGGESAAVAPGGYPTAPSARDRAVGAATEPLRGAAGRLLDRATSIRPVLRLRPGEPISVIVPTAVDLDRPSPSPAPPPPAADTAQARPPAAPTA